VEDINNYEGIFRHTIDGQIVIDSESGRIKKVNNAVLDMFSIQEEDIIGQVFDELFISNSERQKQKEFLLNAAFRDGVIIKEFRNTRNELIPVEIIFSLIPWDGKTAMLASMRNIRERKAAEKRLADAYRRLEVLSRTDPLTTLANRRALLESINYEKFRIERSHEVFSIIICDIDDYKSVNDTYGHNAGDFVLIEVSRLVEHALRKQDLVGRWGGDEFLMILPQTAAKGGRILADNIRKKISDTKFEYREYIINVSMSFGVAEFEAGSSLHECIKNADEALYKAKSKGKNAVL
jgi:diguanylate cyclase (GGDEF)-like protein/PAS domain S-box-containing protein